MENLSNIIVNTGNIYGGITQNSGNEVKNGSETPSMPNKSSDNPINEFKYDIALSYAGEQEIYVSRVARLLEAEGFQVFFAPECEDEFLGKDMITEFYRIYRYNSLFVAAFVTEDYVKKDITIHEAKTALMRTKDEKRNCLIPIYFNEARLEFINKDINYITGDKLREVEIANKIKIIIDDYKKNH